MLLKNLFTFKFISFLLLTHPLPFGMHLTLIVGWEECMSQCPSRSVKWGSVAMIPGDVTNKEIRNTRLYLCES